ncbi:MAG: ornithine carbamoyltransferase [Helicobacteraceae bacterium]
MRHFLTLKDFSRDELLEILSLGASIKATYGKLRSTHLEGKTLGMIFEKSSTRTRVSFEAGIYQLGGNGIFLSARDTQLGRGEPVRDTARVLSQMVDMLMIRTFSQERLEEFARFSTIPVINGLSDSYHPVQLMADYLTMQEFGKDKNSLVCWVGDANNMSNSLMYLCAIMGLDLNLATPAGYEYDQQVWRTAQDLAQKSGARIELFRDPRLAIKNADVVSTDVWTSMGNEAEQERRLRDFAGFTIDAELMSLAKEDALVLHCLPAHRGEEITDDVFEEHAGEIFTQAGNRLHAQKGIMVWLAANQ